ncbi:Uncharacterised protein [Serratia fonticola]|nr:Uncharacterised protein [Serratia fonticola]
MEICFNNSCLNFNQWGQPLHRTDDENQFIDGFRSWPVLKPRLCHEPLKRYPITLLKSASSLLKAHRHQGW